ncbi:hypothetical protein [Propioniferax innocua]|uniref:Activator of Hsp90 ATPase-like protein n=1 Tax=Propioniferax innocua TaxID=1753 RepID=A0A542ZSV3_9ACTN|nr:hypothetical protein [Propioniferax innocua]TQL63435.1 hypothetical protein FB460_1247 [Propioniferax innocua]
MQTTALETGSGITWAEWLEILEPHKDLDHPAMAAKVLEHINARGASKSPEWWAQGVTVAYEQHIGRRGVGERCDGSFSVTVSKTMPSDMDATLAAVDAVAAGRDELAGIPLAGEPRTSATEKWRYWRADLADGSKITINIQNKTNGKSVAAVNHDGLASNEHSDELKAWWRAFLTEIQEQVGVQEQGGQQA